MKPVPIPDVIEAAGGATKLADGLGIRPPSIYSWTQVPPTRVLEVERITGIPRHRLRPDLYPLEGNAA